MSIYYVGTMPFGASSELQHHGIKGQKWGIRRFQNADGTLTAEGRARYGFDGDSTTRPGFLAGRRLNYDLNREEQRSAKDRQREREYSNKANRYRFKAERAKSDTRREKFERKQAKATEKRDSYSAKVKSSRDFVNRVLNDARNNGYTTKTASVNYVGRMGKAIAESMLYGSMLGMLNNTVEGRAFTIRRKRS